jgi:antitoxin component YwqK of YwqJK toxin-antitoxin module
MTMKRLLLTLLIVITAGAALFSQGDADLKDGYHQFRYPNGVISSEGNIRNGKPDGYWKSYYVTGILKSEGKRTSFLLDSIWVFYDQAGDTIEKISYLYGKKNGFYLKYQKDSYYGLYISSRELFAGDKKEGTAWLYYPDQSIKQTIPYSDGKKEGLSKEYDVNGNIITLFEYRNDFMVSRQVINRIDNKNLKQGDWKEFHPNGSISREMTYKDDKLQGYYREYDSRGRLTMTMLYDNGRLIEGNRDDNTEIEVINRYNDSGGLIYSGPYRKGIPVGIHREYDGSGNIVSAKIYNDDGIVLSEGIVNEAGNKTGSWKDFYPDGTLQAEGQYTDNRQSGTWKFYSREGKVEQTGSFAAGRTEGLWRWYFDNGSLLREEEYFQGRRDGSYVEYDRNGNIIVTGEFADGERNGEWKFNTGDYSEEGTYILGLMDGQWKSWYADGTIRHKGNYIQGNAHGTHVFYYPNGKVMEERHFDMGIREKTWKKYGDDGLLAITITYRKDVETAINGIKIRAAEGDARIIK